MGMAAQYYINSPGCRRQLLIADFIFKTEAEMGKTDNDITPFLGPQKVGYFLRRNNRIVVYNAFTLIGLYQPFHLGLTPNTPIFIPPRSRTT